MSATKTFNGNSSPGLNATIVYPQGEKLQTSFEFSLPLGYVDSQGMVHRKGTMRLATALDEIAPLRDPRVRANEAYVSLMVLARVITKLGSLPDVNTGVIEGLFTADMAYLQDFYRTINNQGHALL